MQHLFIRQCNALIETMLFCKKEQETRDLIMGDWVDENQCGFAACVLGHHATMNDITPFINAEKKTFGGLAIDFSNQLDDACRNLFGCGYLAASIYEGLYNVRRSHARQSNLFTDEEIETLNHLKRKEPTFEDVVWYLELVIHKAEQKIEELL